MTGESERRKKERGGDAGLEKKRKEKKRKWKEKKEGRKERNAKERKKERREGGGRPTVAWPVFAGGDRSWPELGGQGPKEKEVDGASLVQNEFLEF